jgi:DNA-binding SARP family transcriptional activator
MHGLQVSLLGKFSMKRGEAEIYKLESRKAEELLCYLLVNRERAHPREALAELLWGDDVIQQSKNYLRKALWQLQSTLEPLADGEKQGLLLVEPEWIQLNPLCDLWLDVAVIEAAFKGVKGIHGRDLTQEQVRVLEAAVALHKGDLLEDCYQDWCLFERERLQYQFLALLDKLMDYCERHQDFESGLVYGERILRYDRAHERTHSRLMRLHYLAGDRIAALRQYDKCKAALHEELDVEPGEQMRRLCQQIRQDTLESDTIKGNEKTAPLDYAALQTIHTSLVRFYTSLDQLQSQLHKDIQALERVLHR